MKFRAALKAVMLLAVTANFFLCQGQFQVGHSNITFIDSSRSNRSVPVHLFYPANDTTLNTPLATGTFPVLIFGHGLGMEWSVYSNVWSYLVPQGYIVGSVETENGFSADFNTFGIDEAFAAKAMEAENQNAASLFYNRAGNLATGGHSMGGSAAILSVNKNSHIATTVGLAPSAQSINTSYDMPDTAATLTIPSLIFAATGDGMAPPATHQGPIYDSLKSACKVLITITGGSHCQFGDPHTLCQTAEAGLGGSATITRQQQHTIINRYLLPWLDYTLKGDAMAWNNAAALLATDNEVTYRMSCLTLGVSDAGEKWSSGLKLNTGSSQGWVLEADNTWVGSQVEILDMAGRHIRQIEIKNLTTEISFEGAKGVYLLHVSNAAKRVTLKAFK